MIYSPSQQQSVQFTRFKMYPILKGELKATCQILPQYILGPVLQSYEQTKLIYWQKNEKYKLYLLLV